MGSSHNHFPFSDVSYFSFAKVKTLSALSLKPFALHSLPKALHPLPTLYVLRFFFFAAGNSTLFKIRR